MPIFFESGRRRRVSAAAAEIRRPVAIAYIRRLAASLCALGWIYYSIWAGEINGWMVLRPMGDG